MPRQVQRTRDPRSREVQNERAKFLCLCSRCYRKEKFISARSWRRHRARDVATGAQTQRVQEAQQRVEEGEISMIADSFQDFDMGASAANASFRLDISVNGGDLSMLGAESLRSVLEERTNNDAPQAPSQPEEGDDSDGDHEVSVHDDGLSERGDDDGIEEENWLEEDELPGLIAVDDSDDEEEEQQVPIVAENIDIETVIENIRLEAHGTTLAFIEMLQQAQLGDKHCKLSLEMLERIQNPYQYPMDDQLDANPDLRLALDLFLAMTNAAESTYHRVCVAVARNSPATRLPSLFVVKQFLTSLTGVQKINYDMCVNSCAGFTGPYAVLDACPYCFEKRYDQLLLQRTKGKQKKARKTFTTILLGPQLQALYRYAPNAELLRYAEKASDTFLREYDPKFGLPVYEDLLCGRDYLEAVAKKRHFPGDPILMLSTDGAQLYRGKQSDCWIGIWLILNYPPSVRYKKKVVPPAFFIPGPNKPKELDSFLFPSLHHLAALQRTGLKIWYADTQTIRVVRPFLAAVTADGPGMAYLNGMVGHHGKYACRLFCGFPGRHLPGGSHYYPAAAPPLDARNPAPAQDITNFATIVSRDAKNQYNEKLKFVLESNNQTQFEARRLDTGIVKPTIFLGLPSDHNLGIPAMFLYDIMHLVALNITDLFSTLWRGTIKCYAPDNRAHWTFAVFWKQYSPASEAMWKAHGKAVADSARYIPGSFDRTPRNVAEKINSGYKAWEFIIWIYGLGPGLLYNILPLPYYRNLCKLVAGIRTLYCYRIHRSTTSSADAHAYGGLEKNIVRAHRLLIEFCKEFEALYYQQLSSRLHFVRPSIHALIHLAPEVYRVGPGMCSSQWVMERTIGNLGQEIRQPSKPYENLANRGVLRSQINTLLALQPSREVTRPKRQGRTHDCGGGYKLLHLRSRSRILLNPAEGEALEKFLEGSFGHLPIGLQPKVFRWARLQLPNGQVARTLWRESVKDPSKVRQARMVKYSTLVNSAYTYRFAEVQFFFHFDHNERSLALALLDLWSEPDAQLLELSCATHMSCIKSNTLQVVEVTKIDSVIAMIPTPSLPGRFFVMEKPALDVSAIRDAPLHADELEEENGEDDAEN